MTEPEAPETSAAVWLPYEIRRNQPYVMCPALGWRCLIHLPAGNIDAAMPNFGGSGMADHPRLAILTMLAPPTSAKRLHAFLGVENMGRWRRVIPGLAEAMERDETARRAALRGAAWDPQAAIAAAVRPFHDRPNAPRVGVKPDRSKKRGKR